MAKYNEILVGRFNRFLQKLTQIKGPAPTPQLSGEIQPVIAFFNGVENRYLDSWNRFAASLAVAGAAGVNTSWRLRNPVGSNVIIVIESLFANGNVSDPTISVQHGPIAVDYATTPSLASTRLDPRGNPQPSAIISTATTAVNFGATIFNFNTNGSQAELPSNNMISTPNQEIPVLPGEGLQVNTSSFNEQLIVMCTWRERFLEESERA